MKRKKKRKEKEKQVAPVIDLKPLSDVPCRYH